MNICHNNSIAYCYQYMWCISFPESSIKNESCLDGRTLKSPYCAANIRKKGFKLHSGDEKSSKLVVFRFHDLSIDYHLLGIIDNLGAGTFLGKWRALLRSLRLRPYLNTGLMCSEGTYTFIVR